MPGEVLCGDCRAVLPTLPADSFDSVVCDPPYELGFMGKSWDRSGVAFDPKTWEAVLRVLKPGGYMLAMGGTRTYHRLACAVEDAGFEIRDCLMWVYGTGFPKSDGCLKPAWEPVILVRKPGAKVLPLGVDECRVGEPIPFRQGGWHHEHTINDDGWKGGKQEQKPPAGRYPANLVHDGSEEVMEAFAAFGERTGENRPRPSPAKRSTTKDWRFDNHVRTGYEDSGTVARYFYCAKASKSERGKGNRHPTVKPLALMRWLVRLVTPPGGKVLDPFAGSGSTLVAAAQEGRDALGVELDPDHCEIARRRVREAMGTGLLAGIA